MDFLDSQLLGSLWACVGGDFSSTDVVWPERSLLALALIALLIIMLGTVPVSASLLGITRGRNSPQVKVIDEAVIVKNWLKKYHKLDRGGLELTTVWLAGRRLLTNTPQYITIHLKTNTFLKKSIQKNLNVYSIFSSWEYFHVKFQYNWNFLGIILPWNAFGWKWRDFLSPQWIALQLCQNFAKCRTILNNFKNQCTVGPDKNQSRDAQYTAGSTFCFVVLMVRNQPLVSQSVNGFTCLFCPAILPGSLTCLDLVIFECNDDPFRLAVIRH
jgi:hypothetical protein